MPHGRRFLPHPIWGLNTVLVVSAVACLAAFAAGAAPIAEPTLPWWALAAAVAACERWPVKLQFGRSAHAFSLTDIPVTLGLLFAAGGDFMLGIAVGTAVALALVRLPAIKLVFNVAQCALATGLGLAVVRLIAGAEPEFGPVLWMAVFLATQLSGVVTICLMAVAMRLAEGHLTVREFREMFGLDVVVTLANTSLALLAAVLVVAEPAAAPIMAVPVALAFLGYRAYVSERERSERAEFLYETNRTLSHAPEVTDAIEGLLERAREAFRADHAEIVLLSNDERSATRTRIDPDGRATATTPVDERAAGVLRDLAVHGAIRLEGPLPERLAPLLTGGQLRHAMVAAVPGEARPVGVIVIADRIGITRGFEDEDLKLFQTLVVNAGAALQFDRLEHAVAELQQLELRLQHQARHDALTGLANRSTLGDQVAAALAGDEDVAVVLLDVDDFKAVNDTRGHGVGDELLRAVGERLRRAVRADDLVARVGGDEFAILVTGGERRAVRVAERILSSFELPMPAGGHLLDVNLSVGIAAGDSTAADLLRDADVAMYEAKAAGKRRYARFTPEMRDAVMRRHALKDELRVGIEREELLVQYQPIVDLATGGTTAVEALVRWQHPEHGRIPPLEFIPLAESTGLIVPLSRFVLRAACSQAVRWDRAGGHPLAVQVNLSGKELDDPDLAMQVLEVLGATGLAPERLVLEITESVLVQDAASGSAQLNRLRDHGIRLALDDFGTGFSSLSYLRSLPLDILKIAKEFTDGVARDSEDATFVRLIIELAAMRRLQVIAEGVETHAQLNALRALNCDLGQGYHFARPLDADDLFEQALVSA